MQFLDKILIANRGEIASRIIRSAKLLGIRTVAVYTESESDAGYVKSADEAHCLGPDDLKSSFLNVDKIIGIAIRTGSKAIHPGYGFLSENADFAKACEAHHLVFIGPRPEVLSVLGNKPEAKALAARLGIPVIFSRIIDPGSLPAELPEESDYPLLVKPSFGGGGKGMQLIRNRAEYVDHTKKASRMAENYFGNGEIFTEQYIRNARHVEVQLLGDNAGNVIHLYERECTIQRNHQKIIEEAPAVFLTPELRTEILTAAVKIGKAVHYTGAGTVEFLVGESGNYYFMEMNPRIQVEHGVTEQITGIDIVSEQLRIASGFPLSFAQDQVTVNDHSIELRVYAENPVEDFAPSPSALLSVILPANPFLRIDADNPGSNRAKSSFDPLLFKLIGWGKDRLSVTALLREQLTGIHILGPETNLKYLESILEHPDYLHNNISTEFCESNHETLTDKYLTATRSTDQAYILATAISAGYLNDDFADQDDPWKNLGYWRISPSWITVALDEIACKIGLNLKKKINTAFELDGVETAFKIVQLEKNHVSVEINGTCESLSFVTEERNGVRVSFRNRQHKVTFPGLLSSIQDVQIIPDNFTGGENEQINSPLHGRILEINTIKNQIIKKGDPLLVIEAMKIENQILSSRDGRVKKISVDVGDQVTYGMPLIYMEDVQ
jgi:acetyl/propionyl-CoA carboxylase alpha subunit